MKRLLAATLAALMLLSAVSCGAGKPDADVTSSETEASTEATETTEATSFDMTEMNYPDGFDYTAIDLSKYIKLGKYKGLTVTLTTSSEITAADVDEYIETVLTQHSRTVEITDRPAKEGDALVIDYTGTMDGVEFEGGKDENVSMTLGAGGWIDGFEEGIVGMRVGETKTIDVTFPDPYKNNPDLAGKPAKFAITLHSISETVYPEYNDTFVRENFDYATMAEYEAYVRSVLTEERQSEILAEKQSGALSIAVDNAEVLKYPAGVVEDYMAQQLDYIKYYASTYGMAYADFVSGVSGMSVEEYEAQVKANAEQSVKEEMVIFAIAKAEGFTISDERRAEELASFLAYYNYDDLATMCEDYGFSEAYMNNTMTFSVYYVDVIDMLVENATFTGAN